MLSVSEMYWPRPRAVGESYRLWLNALLTRPGIGTLNALFQVLLTWSLVAIHIYEHAAGVCSGAPLWSLTVYEFVCVGIILTDYFLRFYATESRADFICQLLPLVDVAVCVVVLLNLLPHCPADTPSHTFIIAVQFVRVLRTFRLVPIIVDPQTRQVALLAVTVLCVVLSSSLVFQAVDYENSDELQTQPVDFFQAVYFLTVTVATVGFGDVTAQTSAGRVVIMITILFSIIVIPSQVGRLSEIRSRRSPYSGLALFLREFLRAGNRLAASRVVILRSTPPTSDMLLLLADSEFAWTVSYLQGSAMSTTDLLRARVTDARAVFVLVDDIDGAHADQIDTAVNLVVHSIHMCVRRQAHNVPIITKILSPANARDASLAGASTIVCSQALSQRLLVLAAAVPGAVTWLSNIMTPIRTDGVVAKRPWMKEYCEGADHVLTSLTFPPALRGKNFGQVARMLLVKFRIVLLGLEKRTGASKGGLTGTLSALTQVMPFVPSMTNHAVLLTPMDMLIGPIDKGIAVCPSLSAAEQVARLTTSQVTAFLSVAKAFGRQRSSTYAPPLTAKSRGAIAYTSTTSTLPRERRLRILMAVAAFAQLHRQQVLRRRLQQVAEDENKQSDHPSPDSSAPVQADAAPPTTKNRPLRKALPSLDTLDSAESGAVRLGPSSDANQGSRAYRTLQSLPSDPGTPWHGARSGALPASPGLEGGRFDFSEADSHAHRSQDGSLVKRVRPDVSNHIIVCGQPLDARELVRAVQWCLPFGTVLVVVAPNMPNGMRDALERQDVYFVQGTARSRRTLAKAGIDRARAVIIMHAAPVARRETHADRLYAEPLMIDSDALTTARLIVDMTREATPRPTVVVGLLHESNIKFVIPHLDAHVGEVRTISQHDLAGLLNDDMLGDTPQQQQAEQHAVDTASEHVFESSFASGAIVPLRLVETLLGSWARLPIALEMVQLLLGTQDPLTDNLSMGQSVILNSGHYMTTVPVESLEMVGEPYRVVCGTLMTQQVCLPVAVLRSGLAAGAPHPYLYTSPSMTTIMEAGDSILIVTARPVTTTAT